MVVMGLSPGQVAWFAVISPTDGRSCNIACLVVVAEATRCLVAVNAGLSAGLKLDVPLGDQRTTLTVAWVTNRRLQTSPLPTGTAPLVPTEELIPTLLTLIEAEAHSDFMSADEAVAGVAERRPDATAQALVAITAKLDGLVTAGSAMERRLASLETPGASTSKAGAARRIGRVRKPPARGERASGVDDSGLWGRQVFSPPDSSEEGSVDGDTEGDDEPYGSFATASKSRKSHGLLHGAPGSAEATQLAMLRMMERLMRKQGGRRKGSSSSGSSSDSSNQSRSQHRKHSSGFKGLRSLKKRMRRKPRKIIERYTEWAKELLGVTHERQVWLFKDVAKKQLQLFGKMRGLWRVYHAVLELIQLQVGGEHEQATAFSCQLAKTILQVAVDDGEWKTACLLLPTPDPLQTVEFGGDEWELDRIYAYQKSLRELRRRGGLADTSGADSDAGTPAPKKTSLTKAQRRAAAKKKKAEAEAAKTE